MRTSEQDFPAHVRGLSGVSGLFQLLFMKNQFLRVPLSAGKAVMLTGNFADGTRQFRGKIRVKRQTKLGNRLRFFPLQLKPLAFRRAFGAPEVDAVLRPGKTVYDVFGTVNGGVRGKAEVNIYGAFPVPG